MSDVVWVALIGVIPGTLAALLSWSGRKQNVRNERKIDNLAITVDGRLTQLLEETRIAAHMLGVSEERETGAMRAASVAVDSASRAADVAREHAAESERRPSHDR